ncbi:MAG: hypothetical protein IPG63_08115 [Xanthomonadales bacterium]|nr:hypothetical protein [Xanthomonadales bacterium]MBK7144398.1 hypothetical protein [Xanthomonadales bacterium]
MRKSRRHHVRASAAVEAVGGFGEIAASALGSAESIAFAKVNADEYGLGIGHWKQSTTTGRTQRNGAIS